MNLKEFIDQGVLSHLNPGDSPCEVKGVAIDSRQVNTGDLFVAISGSVVKGLDYVDAAIQSGAACVLVDEADNLEKARNISSKIPVFTCKNIRRVAARLISQLYHQQPNYCVAVTGTNGKSSVVSFLRQLWALLGHKAASLGTLGLEVEGTENPFPKDPNNLTTPDVVTLHQRLEVLKRQGVDHVAFEASSHGLDQHRLDGVRPMVAAFTNFSQDHLDYHPSMEDYFQAKLRLFTEILTPEGTAVINLMDPKGYKVLETCRSKGIRTFTIGSDQSNLDLLGSSVSGEGQDISMNLEGRTHRFHLPVPGRYQVDNILVAIGVLLAEGFNVEDILQACEKLRPIPGRLELAVPGVYVDYAHTPDALRSAIQAISHEKGHLWVVFGCGGDRDQEKRPLMGQVVAGPEFDGKVIVTDDNPRTEDPAVIRRDILKSVPHAFQVGDRRRAIQAAMSLKSPEDKLLIAGKGHETYQIVGTETHDFDDRQEVKNAMLLWDWKDADKATNGMSTKAWQATGVSIDTRTLQPGDLFVALEGESSDGHAYIGKAFEKGAAAAVVSRGLDTDKPCLKVRDTLAALEALGQFARERATKAKRIAVTGSVGKTSTKEMLKLALSTQGLTHASVSSYNNHWGVPLTLARMPKETKFAIFEVGMNNPGEITPLTKMVQPDVVVITNVAASHLGHFDSILEIAKAKAEVFQGVQDGGCAILNWDNEYFQQLHRWAQETGISNCISFGHAAESEAKISEDCTQVSVGGEAVTLPIAHLGSHLVQNAAAALLAVKILGGDIQEANRNLVHFRPVQGRGDVHSIGVGGGTFTLINESYNANPLSMAAALKVLGSYKGLRKVVVIGDMRELGDSSVRLHEELLDPIQENQIDQVYCCGPYMAKLYEKLPSELKAGYTEASTDLISLVKSGLQLGDVVMVKGSLGTRMKPIVEALMEMKTERDAQVVN